MVAFEHPHPHGALAPTAHLELPFFDDAHRALANGLVAWAREQHVDETDDRVACKDWVQRLGAAGWLRYCVPAAHGGALPALDSRALVIVRETIDRDPSHSAEQQQAGWQAILDTFKRHVEGREPAAPRAHRGEQPVVARQKITPFLWFDGQAEAAARYYVSHLPDSRIDTIVRAPADHPSGRAGAVLTVEFTLCGHRYVALNGGPGVAFTQAVSFQITCADQAEVDRLWLALAEGGAEGQCGWLTDRWGLSWQVVPTRLHELLGDPDGDRARRTMEAMLTMRKLNIAELERAAAQA